MMLDSFSLSDAERRMAVSNALGQRGPKCVTATPWKSPMTEGTVFGDSRLGSVRSAVGVKTVPIGI
jgi:hypothetical protein